MTKTEMLSELDSIEQEFDEYTPDDDEIDKVDEVKRIMNELRKNIENEE